MKTIPPPPRTDSVETGGPHLNCPTTNRPPCEPEYSLAVKALSEQVGLGFDGIKKALQELFEQRQEDHLLLLQMRKRLKRAEARITVLEEAIEGLKSVSQLPPRMSPARS